MPISGVGVKPDGTLGWVDAQGMEVNPDGTPMEGAQQLKPLNPAPNTAPQGGIPTPLGTVGAGPPPAPAAPAAAPAVATTAARDALVKALEAQYGTQQGKSAPVTTTVKVPANAKLADGSPDPNAGKTLQQATDRDLFTFGNGTSAEITADGSLSNLKLGPGAGTAKTGSDIMAAQGQILAPNGQVYVKNTDTTPGAPPYILDTNSQNNQQLANAKTVASTNLDAANAKKQDIQNQIDAATDPSVKAKLANDAAQAAIDVQKATVAKDAADAAYQNGMLGVAQTNAGSTASNAASTAARVGSQNALDTAQAGSVTQNAASTAARVGSQNALDLASAANQTAAAQAATAKSMEPTIQQTGSGPNYTYYDPKTQQMVTAQNPAYLPTDPGRMTAQLKQQADQQWQALQQKVAQGTITGDQAQSQFNQYWDENIEPVKGDIAAAQAKAQAALQYQQAQTGYQNALAANLPATLAQNASSDAQKNFISMMPYMVNSSAGTTPGITTNAKGFPQIDIGQVMANATYSLPNLQEIGKQGAAAALANISPTAQAIQAQGPGAPAQQQQPFDVNSMLNMSQYGGGAGARDMMTPQQLAQLQNTTGQPGGAQVGGPATPAPAQQPPQPPAPPPGIDWNALMGRQQQSAQEQGMQAQLFPQPGAPPAVPPGMYNPAWQGLYPSAVGQPASGPMAGAPTGTGMPWSWPPYQPSMT